MLCVTPEMFADRRLLLRAIRDIHSKGFDTLYVDVRNTHQMHALDSPVVHDLVKAASAEAHRLGMMTYLNFQPGYQGFLTAYPGKWQRIVTGKIVPVRNGRFSLDISFAGGTMMEYEIPRIIGIERAFLVKTDGVRNLKRARDVTAQVTYDLSMELIPRIDGRLRTDGDLLVYISLALAWTDYSSPEYIRHLDECLEMYKDVKLESLGWDEPSTVDVYKPEPRCYGMSESFLRRFKRHYKYDLLDKVYMLDYAVPGDSGATVRYDYYSFLGEILRRNQMHFKKRCKQFFGDTIDLGVHHTWMGESSSSDVYTGDIDYFSLLDGVTGGFVDAHHDKEEMMIPLTILAESLAKYSDTGVPYNMCWDNMNRRDTNLHHDVLFDYAHRLLAVRGVTWVGAAYMTPPAASWAQFPHRSTWNLAAHAIKRQKTFRRFLDGAVSAPRVAILYTWHSLARFSYDYNIHIHRYSLKTLIYNLNRGHTEVDVIPGVDKAFSYDVLFVPWPSMLPEQTWKDIKALATKGVKIIFIGMPAELTTKGRDLSREFAGLLGIAPVSPWDGIELKEQMQISLNGKTVKATFGNALHGYHMFRPGTVDPVYIPLRAKSAEVFARIGRRVVGVRKGNYNYISFDFPLSAQLSKKIFRMLEIKPEVRMGNQVIAKVSCKGQTTVLTATGRYEERLNETFTFKNNRIEVKDALIIGIKAQGDTIVDVIGEQVAELRVNGKRHKVRKI